MRDWRPLVLYLALLTAPALAQDKKISELPDGSPGQATDAIPIARAGGNYRLPFSAFGESLLPPLVKVTTVIPSAQVATLYSSPVTLVAGQADKLIIPERFHYYKAAGTVWTHGSQNLHLYHAGAPLVPFFPLPTLGFFSYATAQVAVSGRLANTSYRGEVDGITGAALILQLGSSDMSGGSSDLTVTIWYRVWGVASP